MELIKAIRKQLATDCDLTVIRADQTGIVPPLPYATYKVLSDRKGVGQENRRHVSEESALIEHYEQERNTTISFNVYGTSHDNAFSIAKQLRKWFERRGSLFLDEWNVAVARVSDVTNRSVFLVDSYDEKYGFDVVIRYIDADNYEIDYFDTVEWEVQINTDTKEYPPIKHTTKIEKK